MPPIILRSALRAATFCAGLILAPLPLLAEQITVFAAASLKAAITKIGADWAAARGHDVVFSFAGSSTLAKQIQQGAPADLFMPASTDWMDALVASGDVVAETRRDILTNRLVLVAHGDGAAPPTAKVLDDTMDLAAMLGDGKLAMAMVDAVPAGIYGRQALVALGQWGAVQPHIVQAENVTGALQFVATGEADFGIVYASDVYASDAKDMPHIRLVGTFPAGSHDPIIYPAAITRQSQNAALAADFLDYMASDTAAALWQQAGFGAAQ